MKKHQCEIQDTCTLDKECPHVRNCEMVESESEDEEE